MGTIFAIGGGEIGELETLAIDKKIVESANKDKPKALFIPTASDERQGYIDDFNYVYGDKLGCIVGTLFLLDKKITKQEAREKILKSDIIYVGGGNTRKMLEIWDEYGVSNALREAYEKGITLSGLSAGSICWFKKGHSDSNSFSGDSNWSYVIVDGLGLIDAVNCPHYDEDTREDDFNEKILKYNEVGIAMDNNCAIEFKDDYYRIHKSDSKAKAYKLYKKDNKVIREELLNTLEYKPIKELLNK